MMDNGSSDLERYEVVKRRHVGDLMHYPNVTGVGIGYRVVGGRRTDEQCIRVYVSEKVPERDLPAEAVLPRIIDGIRVDVIEADFQALFGGSDLSLSERRARHPIVLVGGVSVGGLSVSAGTLGSTVYMPGSGAQLLLSNWHVLCGRTDCSPGEPVVQPGVADGGTQPDTVASLWRFALTDRVDAAVAAMTMERYLIPWISGIGIVSNTEAARLGMKVRKSGRTTGLTSGTITDLSADVDVRGYPPGTIRFRDQLIAESDDGSPIALGGDSGSLVVDDSARAVGLLFAGPRDGRHFVANPIGAVVDALDIRFGPPDVTVMDTLRV